MADTNATSDPGAAATGLLARWRRSPLYLRILCALVLGVAAGLALGGRAGVLELPSKLILRLLSALAPPLILTAVARALVTADLTGHLAGRLVRLLLVNTLVAICAGILVANVLRPGKGANLDPPSAGHAAHASTNVVAQFLDNVPKSLLSPLVDGNVIGVIMVAVAVGLALRRLKDHPVASVPDLLDLAFHTLVTLLHWVVDIVPFGVFGIVASIVGTKGFAPFAALGMFVVAVMAALFLQACYYLLRVWLGSWVRPLALIRGCRDALLMAFSTASSTVTMPLTYECLRERVGLRRASATMGSLVGANFNNDGTALYEAMSALFISQMLGQQLTLSQQLLVVVTSVAASVGAAGIPEAGLVTMTLVFNAVGLPVKYIALLLTVDWFLDRCRTAINVMGDMNVSCLLDGKTREVS